MGDNFVLIGSIVVIVLSITTHEAAHAWVADRLGDHTARDLGRVTLNPLPHIDPFLTILLPALLFYTTGVAFGGAKPVPVSINRLRRPMRDWALVGIAGPSANLAIAIACAVLLSALLHLGVLQSRDMGTTVLFNGIFFNVLLLLFNMIPLPPLDGSRVIMYLLHESGAREALRTYVGLERFGLFLVMALVFFVPGFSPWLVQSIKVICGIIMEVTAVPL